MKIFPIKPMSTLDRIINICKILTKTPMKMKNLESDIASFSENKTLKKGRSICDKLSE